MSTTGMVMTVTDELLAELESRVTSWKCKDHMAIKTLDAAVIIAEVHRLRAENAELAKDAGRYRFIRDVPHTADVMWSLRYQQNKTMDETIDTAMSAE